MSRRTRPDSSNAMKPKSTQAPKVPATFCITWPQLADRDRQHCYLANGHHRHQLVEYLEAIAVQKKGIEIRVRPKL